MKKAAIELFRDLLLTSRHPTSAMAAFCGKLSYYCALKNADTYASLGRDKDLFRRAADLAKEMDL